MVSSGRSRRESHLQLGDEGYHNHIRNHQQSNKERPHPTPSYDLTYHEAPVLETSAPRMSFITVSSSSGSDEHVHDHRHH
jgi:hypothetical protein